MSRSVFQTFSIIGCSAHRLPATTEGWPVLKLIAYSPPSGAVVLSDVKKYFRCMKFDNRRSKTTT
jgi:hypothetical protein